MKKLSCSVLVTLAVSIISFHTFAQGQLWGMASKGGAGEGGVIFKTNADATAYMSVQKDLEFDYKGRMGQSMVLALDGNYYGTTYYSGPSGYGILFKYDPTNNAYEVVHEFVESTGYMPTRGIMLASNGKLYGTTTYGGSGYTGVIYEFDPATNVYQVVMSLTSPFGNQPLSGLIQAMNGKLYGTTSAGGSGGVGVLYELDIATHTAVIRHHFSAATGSVPFGPVMEASNEKLYGLTTEGGANSAGVAYEFNLSTFTYTKRADLSQEVGRTPYGGFTESSVDHKLYALTFYGGANGQGTVIRLDPATNALQTMITLGAGISGRPGSNFIEAPNGKLYCLSFAQLLEYNPVNNAIASRKDFGGDGTGGGGSLCPAIDGKLYGLTPTPISGTRGMLFAFDYTNNVFETKINFDKSVNGATPTGSLVKAGNGKFYGMTSQGGTNDLGVLFELDPATGVYTKKVDFTGTNGSKPSGGMTVGADGKLYGMTQYGGTDGLGVIFQYDPATNTYTKKKDFTAATGKNPKGDLTLAANGKFYGVAPTNFYTPSGYLFEYDPVGDALTVKISFTSESDGYLPDGTLTEATNGKLYGSALGGANGGGVLFEYDPGTNSYTKKIDFSASNDFSESSIGTWPTGRLALAANGKLYGMTSAGGYSFINTSTGTIFEFDPATGLIVRKHRFGCVAWCTSDGYAPRGSLTVGSNNKLYGMTSLGGQSSLYGMAFEFDPANNTFTKKFDFTQLNGANPQLTSFVFVAGKMDQSINFAALEPTSVNVPTITLSATSTAGLPVTYSSSDPAIAGVSGNVVTILSSGSVTITASQVGNSDYNAAPDVERELVITKVPQSISFTISGTKRYSDGFFDLNATSTSGLAVTYSSSNDDVASVTGNTVTIVGVGTAIISANQAGDETYSAATEVTQTLNVLKGTQTITFDQALAKKLVDGTLTLTATSSSDLPVTYVSGNTAIATISGSTVTFVSRGDVVITAKQGGDANYEAAPDVQRTLTVGNSAPEAKKTIAVQHATQLEPFTFTFDGDVFEDPEGDAMTYSAMRQSATSLPTWLSFNATTRTFSGTPGHSDNTVSIQLTATDNFTAATSLVFQIEITVVTATEKSSEKEISVYPNPFKERLTVRRNTLDGVIENTIVIRSVDGKKIYEGRFLEDVKEIEAADWKPGYYLVEVITNKSTMRWRVVKL